MSFNLVRVCVMAAAVVCAIAVNVALHNRPRLFPASLIVSSMSAFLLGFSLFAGIAYPDGPWVLLAIETALPLASFVFGTSYTTGSNMQSFQRALRGSGVQVQTANIRPPREISLGARNRSSRLRWDRLAVPKGLPERAYDVRNLPQIVNQVVVVAVAVSLPAMLLGDMNPVGWRLLVAAVAALPIVLSLLQRRITFAGVLGQSSGRWWYQAVDPMSPWIDSLPDPCSAAFRFRAGRQLWAGFIDPPSHRGVLVLAVDEAAEIPDSAVELTPGEWKRMVWLGIRPRVRTT